MGFLGCAWLFGELRMVHRATFHADIFPGIGFLAEIGDIEKIKWAVSTYETEPDQLRGFWLWKEEDKIAKQIQELGGWATPCDKLQQIACLHVDFHKRTVSDNVLERLAKLPRIGALILDDTPITDAGLARLKGLRQLQKLSLDNTRITDAGLEHLTGFTQLEWLGIENTKVTAEGVKKLQKALPKCEIYWPPPTKDEGQNRAAPDQPGG